ncbi:MAG TPA: GNAT family N-acetyltransferase [Bdellovibrio sp.]|nr:GNAT family N-acetyltransferase [Bdellovibrio sp.]
MSLQYEVRPISFRETLPLRKRVLKPFLSEEECINPGDELKSTYHLGLFHEGNLISVATFIQESHPDFSAGFPYRLRGMATDATFRGQGFGQILLRHGIELLKSKRCDFLWFNARVKAFSFYQRLGFHYHGPLFELKDIGPHKVMYKVLLPK